MDQKHSFCACFGQKDSTCRASLLPPPSPVSASLQFFISCHFIALSVKSRRWRVSLIRVFFFRSGPSRILGLRQRGKLRGSACSSACAALQRIAWPSISSVCRNPPPSRKAARVCPTDTTRRRAAPFRERSEQRDDTDALKLRRGSHQESVFSSGSDSVRHLSRENRKMNMDLYFLKAKVRNMF